MVYNDTTNLNGVVQEIERLADLGQTYFSGDASRLKEVTAMVNQENRKILSLIMSATGNWQFDDSNYTDLSSATTNIVSGQATYALPPTALTVQRIEAKDASGLWTKLIPITKELVSGQAIDEFMKDNGPLLYYRLVNGTIELFPASNYASTDGLKVYFDRDVVDFTVSDTTKTPGFASLFHQLLPLKTAIRWLKTKQPTAPTLALYLADEQKMEIELRKFYSTRFKDYKPRIGRAYQSFK